jgi:Co/Zn/Cd efflux system component
VLVWFTDTPWADLLVALFMAMLACKTGWAIVKHAQAELKAP